MGYYINDLFKETLLEPGKVYDEIQIVSGYSSYSFLKEVTDILPDLKITLILGMTPYGISKDNLEGYRKLCKLNSNIDVYIQIEEPVTHIKLYQWYKNSVPMKCFVGSANFSHSGFKNQREILLLSKLNYASIVSDTLRMCVHCSSEKVEDNIKIYSNEIEYLINDAENSVNSEMIKESQIELTTDKMCVKTMKQIKRNYVLDDDQTKVDLLFHNKKINRGLNKGANSYLDIDKSIEYFNKYLKRNTIGSLEVNGEKLEITRKGSFSRELVILNSDWNFHRIVCYHIGIDFNESIDYADLDRVGLESFIFTKIGNNRFKLDF